MPSLKALGSLSKDSLERHCRRPAGSGTGLLGQPVHVGVSFLLRETRMSQDLTQPSSASVPPDESQDPEQMLTPLSRRKSIENRARENNEDRS